MKKTGQGSIILLTIISIAILFVAVIGATFAYFTVNLQITESEKKVDIKSKALVIEFATTNNIYYENVVPGRPVWEEGEIPLNKLKFSITSPTDMLAKNGYDVYLNIDRNNFVTDNVVFYIKETECFRKDGTGSKAGELISSSKLEYDYDGEIVQVGVIPAGFTGKLKINGGSVLGGLGCTDEWELEIWLHETEAEQNEDQGKTLRATVVIETGTIYPIDHDLEEKDKDEDKDKDKDEDKDKDKDKDKNNN